MDIPEASDRALSAAVQGRPYKNSDAAGAAVSDLEVGLEFLISKPFQWTKTPKFVAFENEGGCCDLVRGRYQTASGLIEVGAAKYVLMVKILGFED